MVAPYTTRFPRGAGFLCAVKSFAQHVCSAWLCSLAFLPDMSAGTCGRRVAWDGDWGSSSPHLQCRGKVGLHDVETEPTLRERTVSPVASKPGKSFVMETIMAVLPAAGVWAGDG
jgi:hypothetical protein